MNTKSLFELSVEAGMSGDMFTHQVMEAFCGIVALTIEDSDVKTVEIEYCGQVFATTVRALSTKSEEIVISEEEQDCMTDLDGINDE
jgi:hypothetical protein